MKARYLWLTAASVVVAVLTGWGVGSDPGDCEQSCPARGPCPIPADCLHRPFNWAAAIVMGALVGATIMAIGAAFFNRTDRD